MTKINVANSVLFSASINVSLSTPS